MITWMPNGKSFVIVNPKAFVTEILPVHFKSAKYASFTRKLHRWGFTRLGVADDEESGEFCHMYFQKGRVDLAMKMAGNAGKFKARRVALKTQEPAPLPPVPIMAFPQYQMVGSEVGSNNGNKAMELEAMRLKKSLQAAAASRRFLAMIQQQRKNAFLPSLRDPRSSGLSMGYSAPVVPLYHLYRQQMGADAWLQALRTSQPSISQKVMYESPRIKNILGAMTA
jgi:hypothetical protein